jgi:hypothetical protein
MTNEEYMQVYCAALTGLIEAQGRRRLLSQSYEIKIPRESVQIPEVLFDMERAESDQIDLISGLNDVAKLIASSARETLEIE